jgi:predicted nucleic acid-binding protein
MNVFVDTSAFLALLDADEQRHVAARRVWAKLANESADLYCTSYVLVETAALVQSRLGMPQLQAFHENVFPFLRVIWVDSNLHGAGMAAVLTAKRRQLSLVDCVSFAAMRQSGISYAFAFDQHFEEQGFNVL